MLSICDFYVLQKRIAIIFLPIFDKLQFVVSICQKSFTGYHILLLELISFQKLQTPKHRQRQFVNYVMRKQRLHKVQYHRRFLVLFSMLYPFFSTKSKESSMKRSATTHVSLKYRQRIFYSLLRAYCFPNNFDLNLVE